MTPRPSHRPAPVVLRHPGGTTDLHASALELAAEAVEIYPDLSRSEATAAAIRHLATGVGADVTDADVAAAAAEIQRRRRTGGDGPVTVRSSSRPTPIHSLRDMAHPAPSTLHQTPLNHFEAVRRFPDEAAGALYDGLGGLDAHKRQLLTELELLLYPDRVAAWSRKHHGAVVPAAASLAQRAPLVIFQGDVGTGKTALAESVGDALARHVSTPARRHADGSGSVYLLKLTTQVRGSGLVGEMSSLISSAFDEAEAFAKRHPGRPVLLLLDEADALASSRESAQMHHEDRAGLNTLIQRLDNLRLTPTRITALFVTNRPGALDPAVRRRAALVLTFERPGDDARRAILERRLAGADVSERELTELVRLTGEDGDGNGGVPFTASDVTDRLFGSAIREAYAADSPLGFDALARTARDLTPTPPFHEALP